MAEETLMIEAEHAKLIATAAAEHAVEKAKPAFEKMAYDIGRKLQGECVDKLTETIHTTFKHVLTCDLNNVDSIEKLQSTIRHAKDHMNGTAESARFFKRGIIAVVVAWVSALLLAGAAVFTQNAGAHDSSHIEGEHP